MCGIGGFYRTNEGPVTKWERESLLDLWMTLEQRGNMACGVALPCPDNSVAIIKSAAPSSEFGPKVWGGAWHKNRMPRWVMLHTRLTTHGSQWNNLNNHPMMSGNVVLSHNGVIWNHNTVLKEVLGVKRQRQVDTEAILQCIVRGGIDEVVQHIRGSYSIAYTDEPGSLCLFANGSNPLVYARLYNGNYFYASTREIINSLGLKFKYVKDCKPGTLYRFNLNGLTKTTHKLPEVVVNRKPAVSTDWRDYADLGVAEPKSPSKSKQTTFREKVITIDDIDYDDLYPRRGWEKWRDAY